MKKTLLSLVVFSTIISTTTLAQVSTSPEVPRNYKPHPKELLPMPGELTDQMIFPVLGHYEYTNADGQVAIVVISKDSAKKGTVWINGMPQGKFKADLRVSPATYKISAQKTLMNELQADVHTDGATEQTAQAVRYSGMSIKEGTLLFDSTSNKLYINEGAKYNDEAPSAVFPEIGIADSTTIQYQENETATALVVKNKKKNKDKKHIEKGTNYVLTKMAEQAVAPVN